jgi:hypothetical protein
MLIQTEHIEKKGLALAGIFVIGSLWFHALSITAGVAVGAGLAILNFRWLRRFVRLLVSSADGERPVGLLFLLYSLKYLLTGIIIFAAFALELADPFGLLAGVSVIVLAICWEAISFNQKLKEVTRHA